MQGHDGVPVATAEAERPLLLEISNQMVRIYKEQFGRGPTKARSDWASPDTLLCTLRESLTPAEGNLVEMGEHQRVRETRMCFQHASQKEFVGTVERLVGREVIAFVSGIDAGKDVSAELFYFEPRRTDG